MSHPIHRVTEFRIVGAYPLSASFADTTEQQIDFRPVLHGVMFGPLQDPATFKAVTLDSEAGTLVWPNSADFDPATLNDWPNVSEELAVRTRAGLTRRASSGLTDEWSRRAADPCRRLIRSTSAG